MRMTGATTCYPNEQEMPIYGVFQEPISSSNYEPNPTSFLYNLSLLKDKVQQVQSLATIFLSPDHAQPPQSTAIAVPTMGTLIQEIIVTASSMMFACQQMGLNSVSIDNNNNNNSNNVHLGHQHANKVVESGIPLPQLNCDQLGHQRANKVTELGTPLPQLDHHRANKVVESSTLSAQSGSGRAYFSDHHDAFDHWYGDNYNIFTSTNNNIHTTTNVTSSNTTKEGFYKELTHKMEKSESSKCSLPNNYDIVELDASDLLAKYTHYCQVCGKGFKRDANLRMHMRAHGDEYKSIAALSNPMKNNISAYGENADDAPKVPRKYSCPQEGCRWNKRHAKFQPLKSMICVKNHYKRSHCPKMYVCKRCNTKQFSVLSDLRTHEKHCGDLKWQCSCGTTFSRKDKLMGHVALFIGHSPVVSSLMKVGNGAQDAVQMQLDDSR